MAERSRAALLRFAASGSVTAAVAVAVAVASVVSVVSVASAQEGAVFQGGGYAGLLLKTLLYLGAICLVLVFGLRWLAPRAARWQAGAPRRLSMLDRYVVGPNKSVCVMKVLDRYLVVGVTEGGMRVLAELSKEEALAAYPNAAAAETQKEGKA